jgi:WhiB family redox-sensing transcriptional regulator
MKGLSLARPPEWSNRAACQGLDPAIFYPDADLPGDDEMAKAICSFCPVQRSCLEHAIAFREWEGIWGGATEAERRRIVRQRRRAAHPSGPHRAD